jgi:hypothetical protein
MPTLITRLFPLWAFSLAVSAFFRHNLSGALLASLWQKSDGRV